MLIVCPDCGADQQEVGKYCENCGRLLTEADAQAPRSGTTPPTTGSPPWNPAATPPGGTPAPWEAAGAGGTAAAASGAPQAHFAVVRNGQANPAEGFSFTHPGEYLVGRPNMETGSGVDVDLRQWVQPLEFNGQKQYLVHRNQCFLGLGPDGAITIRPCPGAEGDTLIRAGGQSAFVPLAQFSTVRGMRPDSSYELGIGDQIYMGDPTAVQYYQTGDATAQGTYIVLELLPS